MRTGLIPALLTLGLSGTTVAQSQPLLQLQGQPHVGGSMKLHLTGTIGQPALLAYGLDSLTTPLQTSKGPWYVGSMVNLVALGNIPAGGRIDMPFAMPPLMPGFAGIPIVMQAYVPLQLSNPTTLPLDLPYYVPASATLLASPNPTEIGLFGDKVATGDLNGDGDIDIAVGAWWEDAGGIDRSGRVYVFWGPSMSSITMLEPPSPKIVGGFGMGLIVADLDHDGIDDLVVGEGIGDPPPPAHGFLHVFKGGESFETTRSGVVTSAGIGTPYTLFGRAMVTGDFNGDGDADLAVGAPTATVQGMATAGQVDVYWGPDFTDALILNAPDLAASSFVGDRLAAGDVNGDGIDDLVVGAPRKKLGSLIAMGRTYLFTGPNLDHYKTLEHPLPSGANSRFGNAVVTADLNGDGIAEVVATDQRNHAFVFWSPNFDDYLLITRPPDPVSGTAISVSFGYFATSGDVNGDGLLDVIVSEPFAESKGRVYASLAPFFADFHVLMDKVPEHLAEFGWGVHLRDVDGDGRDELLVGSDTADPNGVASSGRVTVFDFDL